MNLRRALERSINTEDRRVPIIIFKDPEGRLINIASPVDLNISEVETAPLLSLVDGQIGQVIPRSLWSMVKQFIHRPFTSYLAQ